MANYNGVTAPSIAVQFFISSTWTSVTAGDVLETSIRRGRKQYDILAQAGAASVIFNN